MRKFVFAGIVAALAWQPPVGVRARSRRTTPTTKRAVHSPILDPRSAGEVDPLLAWHGVILTNRRYEKEGGRSHPLCFPPNAPKLVISIIDG